MRKSNLDDDARRGHRDEFLSNLSETGKAVGLFAKPITQIFLEAHLRNEELAGDENDKCQCNGEGRS